MHDTPYDDHKFFTIKSSSFFTVVFPLNHVIFGLGFPMARHVKRTKESCDVVVVTVSVHDKISGMAHSRPYMMAASLDDEKQGVRRP
uniref:Uncharacterized protein n=1 Tax=Romanomermis culicivorax TaxID=13658 RepID=A0A915HD77_ROMCU